MGILSLVGVAITLAALFGQTPQTEAGVFNAIVPGAGKNS